MSKVRCNRHKTRRFTDKAILLSVHTRLSTHSEVAVVHWLHRATDCISIQDMLGVPSTIPAFLAGITPIRITDSESGEFPPTPITPSVATYEVLQLRNELHAAQQMNTVNNEQSKSTCPSIYKTQCC
jgi:hypothetical protein